MRVKTGVTRRQKHNKVLHAAKGFWMDRHRKFKAANEAVLHAGQYAFNGRRIRRRDIRKLWIVRLNAALKPFAMRYSVFISKLKTNKIELNRKMLSELAIHDPEAFKAVVTSLK